MFEAVTPDPGLQALSRAARIFIVLAVLGAIVSVVQLIAFLLAPGSEAMFEFLAMAVSALVAYVTARGIEAQRPYAKLLGYMQGILLLLTSPIGALVGIFVLIYVYRASKAGLFDPSSGSTQLAAAGAGDDHSTV